MQFPSPHQDDTITNGNVEGDSAIITAEPDPVESPKEQPVEPVASPKAAAETEAPEATDAQADVPAPAPQAPDEKPASPLEDDSVEQGEEPTKTVEQMMAEAEAARIAEQEAAEAEEKKVCNIFVKEGSDGFSLATSCCSCSCCEKHVCSKG